MPGWLTALLGLLLPALIDGFLGRCRSEAESEAKGAREADAEANKEARDARERMSGANAQPHSRPAAVDGLRDGTF